MGHHEIDTQMVDAQWIGAAMIPNERLPQANGRMYATAELLGARLMLKPTVNVPHK